MVGIDVSARQIALARERTRDGGIDYRALAAADIGREFGPEFDLVTGVFLLNYAESLLGLIKMLTAIAGALREGGRFAGITQSPRFRFYRGIRFQRRFRRQTAGPTRDGEKFFIDHKINSIQNSGGETVDMAEQIPPARLPVQRPPQEAS